MEERACECILAEARGDPLALRELPRVANLPAFAGGFRPDGHRRPLARRIERSFATRVPALPADTGLLWLIAAADPVGEAAVLWRAAELLGVPESAAEPEQAAELITIGRRVWFRHPLMRSAGYESGGSADRRRVPEAFADAIDPWADAEDRARQRGQAATSPDEAIAAELARNGRARTRPRRSCCSVGVPGRCDRADPGPRRARVPCTGSGAREARRRGSRCGARTGRPGAGGAAGTHASGPDRAASRADHVLPQPWPRRAGIAAVSGGTPAGLDPLRSRETYLEATAASVFAGRLGWTQDSAPAGIARAVRSVPSAPSPPGRSTCCSTASCCGSPRATRPQPRAHPRRAAVPAGFRLRCRRFARVRGHQPDCARPASSRGTTWRPGRCGFCGHRACCGCCRSRWPTAPAGACTPGALTKPLPCSKSPMPSPK